MIKVPKSALTDYLLCGLGYAATDRYRDASLLAKGLSVYRTAVGNGIVHVPFFLVLDLRTMAELGSEFSFTESRLEGFDRAARSRYENRILNRLLREFCFIEALELLAYYSAVDEDESQDLASDFATRADRLALIVLRRLAPHWPEEIAVNAAHLRSLVLAVPADTSLSELEDRWRADAKVPEDLPRLQEQLDRFVQAATGAARGTPPVAWSEIVLTKDLFELQHLHVLDKEYLRITVRQLIDIRESVPELDPRDIQLREEESEVETFFLDQSRYPTGGFSELTTRGSFENLVLSELVYMDEAVAPELRDIDLFDVRFVENELLYYTRDSGQLLRKRRALNVVIDMRSPLSIKYPNHPYQLGTLVAGFVLILIRDLALLFSRDALRFHLHLWHPGDTAPDRRDAAAKLCEVLEILLAAPIQHGLASVETNTTIDLDEMASSRTKSYLIGMSTDPTTISDWADHVALLRQQIPRLFGVLIDLAEGEDHLEHESTSIIKLDMNEGDLASLQLDLLVAIMTA